MTTPRPPLVALVALVPDLGHVIPLLRLGAALQRAGARVVAFLPDACEAASAPYELELRPGGPQVSARTKQLAARFGHSALGRALISPSLLRYFAAVRYDASLALGGLRAALDDLAPDVLLADPHGLAPWMRALARSCGAALIFHESEGTLRRWQPLPVQLRGLAPRRPVARAIHRGLAYVERAAARSVERALRWGAGPEWQEAPETLDQVAEALELPQDGPARRAALHPFRAAPITLPQEPPPAGAPVAAARRSDRATSERTLTTGIAPLELREGRAGLVEPAGITCVGPLPGASPALSAELARWLAAGPPVVYLSFGTMLRVDPPLLRAMSDALAALGLRGLWAIPPSRAAALVGVRPPAHLRLEPHVSQLTVLRRPEVVCCVTHAGAGTVQESLWAGKPMLCVPALWDQFYNASWVEQRGAGLRLSPRRADAASLRRALAALVQEPAYAAAARQLGLDFVAERGEARLVALVAEQVSARRDRRRD